MILEDKDGVVIELARAVIDEARALVQRHIDLDDLLLANVEAWCASVKKVLASDGAENLVALLESDANRRLFVSEQSRTILANLFAGPAIVFGKEAKALRGVLSDHMQDDDHFT